MGGMFPSTQALVFRVPFASQIDGTTPATPTFGITPTEALITIFKPDNTAYFNDVASAAGGNLTITKTPIPAILGGFGFWTISIAAADAVSGVWSVIVFDTDLTVFPTSDSAQWGGLADMIVAINTETQAGGTMYESVATTEATTGDINVTLEPGGAVYDKIDLTRKYVGNKWEANSSTVPTYLILYDDDGTTAMASRNIANADGTAVSPAQVLNLGEIA